MEFTTAREHLLDELNLFAGVVDRKPDDGLSVFSNVSFTPIESGCSLVASGGEIGQRSSIEADAGGEGSMSLPLDRLVRWLTASEGESVVFEETEENWIVAKCGGKTSRYPTRVGDPPEVALPPEQALGVLEADLLATLLRTGSYAFPTGNDITVTNAGAQLELEGSQVRVVSSDHSRLAYSAAETAADSAEGEKKLLSLSLKTISQLQTLARASDGAARVFERDNHLFFEMGKRLLVCSKLADRLPDYDHVIPRNCPIFVRANRDALLSGVRAALPFAAGEFNRARLEITDEQIQIDSSSVHGEETSLLPIEEARGGALTLNVNLVHFEDFAKSFDSEFATLEFQSPEKAFILRPSDGSGKDDDRFDHFCVGMPLV